MPDPVIPRRVRVRDGWEGARREGTLLFEADMPDNGRWAMVDWDDAEDPDCHKVAGLETLQGVPYRNFTLAPVLNLHPASGWGAWRNSKNLFPDEVYAKDEAEAREWVDLLIKVNFDRGSWWKKIAESRAPKK